MAASYNEGFTLTPANGDPEAVKGMNVTATFLPTLRVTPVLGRNFTAEEDRPGGNTRVVVMSDGLWRRAFAADPGVIGRSVTLNAQPYTVIGVLPPSFQWGTTDDLLSPLAPDPARNRADHRLSVIGRLAEGSSIEQATTELETIASGLGRAISGIEQGLERPRPSFYDRLIPDTTRRSLLVLFGAVGLVLLSPAATSSTCCWRGVSQQRELSIRSATGASRSRVLRQLLYESALIAVIAAALGIGLLFRRPAVAERARSRLRASDSTSSRFRLRYVVFATGVALTTILVLFGLVLVIQSARRDPQDGLRADSRGSASGAGRRCSRFNLKPRLKWRYRWRC